MTRSADVPIRVLLIEDNPGDVRLIEELLAEADDNSFGNCSPCPDCR